MRLPTLIRARRGVLALLATLLVACGSPEPPSPAPAAPASVPAARSALPALPSRPVIYQLLPRLYGNRQQPTRPWGTIAENGVGRFADLDERALTSIRELGASHIWYTGVLRHAVIGDYSVHGIPLDDPDVVKGRAGSPYAIADYYDVNPDLAQDPVRRMDEFRALVARSHAAGLRVIIDIVPNHVARAYRSVAAPEGVRDFGADDDRSVEYARDNSYYYVVDAPFAVPEFPADRRPLGGEAHPLADGRFEEQPARWTGNDVRRAQPSVDDWYETVKLNFGVRPDGSHDFPALPESLRGASAAEHLAFWEGQDVPRTWTKFREIADYWLDLGVAGFRFDMAEMVPVPFWSYLNAHIKSRRPDVLLIAEIYQPARYREYLDLGLMDLLYDKVDVYDGLKAVVQGKAGASSLEPMRARLADIDRRLLRFIENHDEQRVASPAFAGNARAGLPLMLYSG
nr:alpha-amylase family glycosyl hydrolase [Xanthomonadales bacterium]